jgi:hypothetical protein
MNILFSDEKNDFNRRSTALSYEFGGCKSLFYPF